MSKVDAEIYIQQIIGFFEKNPNDLFSLIGDLEKNKFYDMIKETAMKNYDETGDASLTHNQMIDIVVDLYNESQKSVDKLKIVGLFMEFKFAKFGLN